MCNKETEVKICKVCGKELSLDRFELMKPNSNHPYRLNTCKDCRYKYMRNLIEKKQDVKLSDDIEILVHRAYKKINPERILDLSIADIQPIAIDEMFVKLMDYKDIWLSNYGRAVKCISKKNEYKLLKGSENSDGTLTYTVRKNKYINGKWTYTSMHLYVSHAVVREFVVNPDTVNNVFIWHRENNKKDNYYKNLYPLNKDQYYALRRYFNKNKDDSEKTIIKIMNDIRFKPDDWSARSMKPTMCGIGYHGREGVDCKSKAYLRWHDMMHRCYNDKFHRRQPQYKECTVCQEWWNFCNFEKWYDEHYYEIEDEIMDLDKDILFKGNKEYGPNTCCVIPHYINTLFITGKKGRGDLPLGTWYDREKGKYRASMSYQGIPIKIGSFKTIDDAFERYKTYKEDFIKDVAEQYKGKIPDKVYRAMLNWTIEITD